MTVAASPFRDQCAVVTGAGGTLCSVLAKGLAAEGARVALLGRSPAPLAAVADEIRAAGGTALAIPCDVLDAASVEAARTTITGQLGPCRFLLNGAGGNQPPAVTTCTEFDPAELRADKPADLRGFFNLGLDAIDSVIRTNTLGTIIPSQVFGRDMAALGRGGIINFASMNSTRALTRVPAYALAKAGIVNFTQWLAVYLAPAGIRVNGIAPGFFVNERSRRILTNPDGSMTQRGKNVMQHTPMKRFGEAPELLGATLLLLDDTRSAFITGQTIAVDGGFLAATGV
jgi:NAD(P)-dependent dehydrogenase (short-subunit alcohol dehydrogenase family)